MVDLRIPYEPLDLPWLHWIHLYMFTSIGSPETAASLRGQRHSGEKHLRTNSIIVNDMC